MRRVGIVVAVALPLAAVDLWLKSAYPTEPWAYHQRSVGWLLLSLCLLTSLMFVARVPSMLVPPAAGVLAAGLLGNMLSASWNDMRVPNPIVLSGGRGIIALNLADVWALVGIILLVATIGAWLVRNRELLPTHAEARARWARAFGRRS